MGPIAVRWLYTDVSGLPIFPIIRRQAIQEETTLDGTDRRKAVLYRRFGTAYHSHHQASSYPRRSLTRDGTHRSKVVWYRRFGTTYRSHHQGSSYPRRRSLKMGLLGSPEKIVSNHLTPRNIPEDRRIQPDFVICRWFGFHTLDKAVTEHTASFQCMGGVEVNFHLLLLGIGVT